MNLAQKLVAPQLAELEPYQSARRIGGSGQVYLNANELPFPAFNMPAGESWNRYPDFLPTELANTYADYCQLAKSQVIAVRGADEGIDLLVRAFCEPRVDSVRLQSPTYSMYDFIAQAHQVAVETIPLDDHFDIDLAANTAPAESLKLIFICNPNNPTGNPLSLERIQAIATHYRESALIVVDEAYIEFCPERSLAPLIDEHSNLVILRTLSKAFGLAANRTGFILADESIIEVISILIAPYPMPDVCAQIGIDALSPSGLDFMQQQADKTIKLRNDYSQLFSTLANVDTVYASETNFILLKFDDSARVFNALCEKGIILRDQNHLSRLPNHLRISIGTIEEMQTLFSELQDIA